MIESRVVVFGAEFVNKWRGKRPVALEGAATVPAHKFPVENAELNPEGQTLVFVQHEPDRVSFLGIPFGWVRIRRETPVARCELNKLVSS